MTQSKKSSQPGYCSGLHKVHIHICFPIAFFVGREKMCIGSLNLEVWVILQESWDNVLVAYTPSVRFWFSSLPCKLIGTCACVSLMAGL